MRRRERSQQAGIEIGCNVSDTVTRLDECRVTTADDETIGPKIRGYSLACWQVLGIREASQVSRFDLVTQLEMRFKDATGRSVQLVVTVWDLDKTAILGSTNRQQCSIAPQEAEVRKQTNRARV